MWQLGMHGQRPCTLARAVPRKHGRVPCGSFTPARYMCPSMTCGRWMAPESLSVSPAPIFSHSSDVFSFGVFVWEVGLFHNYPRYMPHNARCTPPTCTSLRYQPHNQFPPMSLTQHAPAVMCLVTMSAGFGGMGGGGWVICRSSALAPCPTGERQCRRCGKACWMEPACRAMLWRLASSWRNRFGGYGCWCGSSGIGLCAAPWEWRMEL